MIRSLLRHLPPDALEKALDRLDQDAVVDALPNLPGRSWLLARWRRFDAETAQLLAEHLDASTAADVLRIDRRVGVFEALCRNPSVILTDAMIDRAFTRNPALLTDAARLRLQARGGGAEALLANPKVRHAISSQSWNIPVLEEIAARWDDLADVADALNPASRVALAVILAAQGDVAAAAGLLAATDPSELTAQRRPLALRVSVPAPAQWQEIIDSSPPLLALLLEFAAMRHETLDLSGVDDDLLGRLDASMLRHAAAAAAQVDGRLARLLIERDVARTLDVGCVFDDDAATAFLDAGIPCAERLDERNDPAVVARAILLQPPVRIRNARISVAALALVVESGGNDAAVNWAAHHALRSGSLQALYASVSLRGRLHMLASYPMAAELLSTPEEVHLALEAGVDLSPHVPTLLTGDGGRTWPAGTRRALLRATAERVPSRSWARALETDPELGDDLRAVLADLPAGTAVRLVDILGPGSVDDATLDVLLARRPLRALESDGIAERAARRLAARLAARPEAWENALALLPDWTGSFDELLDTVDAL